MSPTKGGWRRPFESFDDGCATSKAEGSCAFLAEKRFPKVPKSKVRHGRNSVWLWMSLNLSELNTHVRLTSWERFLVKQILLNSDWILAHLATNTIKAKYHTVSRSSTQVFLTLPCLDDFGSPFVESPSRVTDVSSFRWFVAPSFASQSCCRWWQRPGFHGHNFGSWCLVHVWFVFGPSVSAFRVSSVSELMT